MFMNGTLFVFFRSTLMLNSIQIYALCVPASRSYATHTQQTLLYIYGAMSPIIHTPKRVTHKNNQKHTSYGSSARAHCFCGPSTPSIWRSIQAKQNTAQPRARTKEKPRARTTWTRTTNAKQKLNTHTYSYVVCMSCILILVLRGAKQVHHI